MSCRVGRRLAATCCKNAVPSEKEKKEQNSGNAQPEVSCKLCDRCSTAVNKDSYLFLVFCAQRGEKIYQHAESYITSWDLNDA